MLDFFKTHKASYFQYGIIKYSTLGVSGAGAGLILSGILSGIPLFVE
ncbi:MAG: hypothetical protein PF447_05675 [Spirochaetaceae bacterium]|nr:hypothetical protein [Spirochaetaceae bacterium]